MDRRRITTMCVLLAAVSATGRPAAAQLSLSDDVILAAQNETAKQQANKSGLGRAPGAPSPLFGASTNPKPLTLQKAHAKPHREFLRRVTHGPGDEMSQKLKPGQPPGPPSPMNVPSLVIPPAIPEPEDDTLGADDRIDEDAGPPGGLTLDQAIGRLIVANHELRTLYHEISMAESDILTAGLRENPLVFYDTTHIPYGSFNAQQPGSIEHGISLVYPIDYSGKRKARVAATRAAKRVREAQYQDAVRLEIDNLYAIFVDLLDSRDQAHRAEDSLRSLDRLMDRARREGNQDDLDELTIDRETMIQRLGDERKRLLRARQILAESLALSPSDAARLEPYGTLRDEAPLAPPTEQLVQLALERRPDVVAHRLGVPHAIAELERAKAERLPNAYLLYSPFNYTDRPRPG